MRPLKYLKKKSYAAKNWIVSRMQYAAFLLVKWFFSFDRVKQILINRIDKTNKKQLEKALEEYGRARNDNS